MPKVLISDKLSQNAVDIFATYGVDADVKTGLSAEELQAIIGVYDGLAIRSATKVTEAVLTAADNLKVVGRAGIGVDNVDIVAATKRGVVVMNTPYGNAVTTAEHAIAMMLALARQIPQASQSTKAGKWEKSRFMGTELTGKRLGLVGCGNIGSIVAERAPGLRMRLVGYDPYLSEENAKRMGVEKVDLDELLRRANFISIHTPMTAATRNIIGADALNKTKQNKVCGSSIVRGAVLSMSWYWRRRCKLAMWPVRRLMCLCRNRRPIIFCLISMLSWRRRIWAPVPSRHRKKWLCWWLNRWLNI